MECCMCSLIGGMRVQDPGSIGKIIADNQIGVAVAIQIRESSGIREPALAAAIDFQRHV